MFIELEEKLNILKEKRQARYSDISKAKTNKELDEIDFDLRKMDFEIKDIEQKIEQEDPAARSLNDGVAQGGFNPLATYRKTTEPNKEKNKEKRDIKTNDTIFLRSGESFLKKIKLNDDERNLDLGKCIRGLTLGEWKGAEREYRALMTSATGVIIPRVLSLEIFDVARNLSLFTSADVPILPMESDNVSIARMKNDPTFKFKEEGKEAEESTFELEKVELKSKMCYGYAYVSLEAIKSSLNLNSILTNAFAGAIAEAIDQAMLHGQYNGSSYDEFAPSGIMNDELINNVDAEGMNGYDAIIRAIGKVRKNNGMASVYGINSDTEEALSLLKDSDGKYLTPPRAVDNLKQIVSNQLKNDSINGNEALVFDPNAMIIGIQENINIQMTDNTDECIKKGLVAFRVYSMLDCVAVKPKNICKIVNLK